MNKCVFTLGLILTSIYTTTAMAAYPGKQATNVWTNSVHTILAMMRCGDCCKSDCWLPNGTYYDNTGTFSRSCTGEPSEPSCISGATYGFVTAPGPSGEQICMPTSCPAGYFLPAALSGCQNCPKNYYCVAGSTSITPCTNAPANAQYTATNVGASNCPWECKDGYKKSGSTCVADCSGYNIGSGSFACVDHTVNGTANGYYSYTGTSLNTSTYSLTKRGTWGVTFSYGTVKGEATCNAYIGDGSYVATPNAGFTTGTTGAYCWCRMTSPKQSQWIYYSMPGASLCQQNCTSACANSVKTTAALRKSMYQFLGN